MAADPSPDLQAVVGGLTRSGSAFEMIEHASGDQTLRLWRNGPQTLIDVFIATQPFEEREFLVLGDERCSYGRFRNEAQGFADWLALRGCAAGDTVAVALPNSPDWIVAYFGIALAGCVSALINPAGTPTDLSASLSAAQPRVLICTSDVLRKCDREGANAKSAKFIVVVDKVSESMSAALEAPIIAWQDARGHSGSTTVSSPTGGIASATLPDSAATIFFTAGTTGQSKGVVLSHRACAYSIFHAGFRNARSSALAGQTPPVAAAQQQVLLMVLPLFHTSGICNAVLPLMMRGGRIVMTPFWSAKSAARLIRAESVNLVGSVPVVLEQLLSEFQGAPPAVSLQQMICGGAPPDRGLAARVAGAGLIPGQNWGMTETAGALLGLIGPEFAGRPESCGLPSPVHDVRIVARDGGPAAPGEVGELQVRGPQVMLGYLDDAVATEMAFDGEWLRTGDLAYRDTEGYCFIVDRAKDMVICAGENVYCLEVENAIASHPAVAEVAVFGLPHDVLGEQPVAVVKSADNVDLDAEDIRRHAALSLALFKVPQLVIVTKDPLPRNSMGKVLKRELRAALTE
ncbi:MAG: hypothetical protein RIR33_656 [Pseudomonadota bacterium]|jgi:long-chain acyl-CoA synthetase